ncbi:hypothetical protein A2U01_0097053 [Trifolium medium]|uniref:Uncharacterized protein n=1 Tax=Trifolium medium TaxID=97028 RepID=A0A392UT42_9FABA|nr:hypothetical protein [Trifolium medium]
MKLRNAQLTEVPDAFFSLTGATRHPLLRDAQLAEQLWCSILTDWRDAPLLPA